MESDQGKRYAWALNAFDGPVSELIEHERTHPAGHIDIALTASLEAKRHQMKWDG